jgi:hypothetical protein
MPPLEHAVKDDPAATFEFEVREGDTLWITSPWKLWWFTKFRGYRVITVRQVPQESAFGRVRYLRRWLIGVKDKK